MTAWRSLYGAAAALGLTGLALQIAPTPLPRARAAAVAPIPVPHPAASGPSARGAPSYAAIVAGNVFSAARRAPRIRFAPRGATGAVHSAGAAASRQTLRLYGITVATDGTIALIDADPTVPGAELYRVGDLVAGARLVAVTDSTVTLAEPSGPLVLRLPPAHRRTP